MVEDSDLLHGKELRGNKHRIQHLATQQLLNSWKKHKDRDNDPFFWGDEMECLLLHLDNANQAVRPEQVPWSELEAQQNERPDAPALQPELGIHMLEYRPRFAENNLY